MARLTCALHLLCLVFVYQASFSQAADFTASNETEFQAAVAGLGASPDSNNRLILTNSLSVTGPVNISTGGAGNLTLQFNGTLNVNGTLQIQTPGSLLIQGALIASDNVSINAGNSISILGVASVTGNISPNGSVSVVTTNTGQTLILASATLYTVDNLIIDAIPGELASAPQIQAKTTRALNRMLSGLLGDIRDDGPNSPSLAFRLLDPDLPLTSLSSLMAQSQGGPPPGLEWNTPPPDPSGNWTPFAQGFGTLGRIDETHASGAIDYSTAGLSLGATNLLAPGFIAGPFAAYHYSDQDFRGLGGGMDIHGGKAGALATWWNPQGWWVDGIAGMGVNGQESTRFAAGETVDGSTWGLEGYVEAGMGRDFQVGSLRTGPYVRLAYNHQATMDYRERSLSGVSGLAFDDASYDSLATTLGWNMRWSWTVGGVRIRPRLHAAWVHECMDDQAGVDVELNAIPGSSFRLEGPELERDSVNGGASVLIEASETVFIRLGYEAEANGQWLSHSFDGGARWML